MGNSIEYSRWCPIDICEEIFLDMTISSEAKEVVGIINTRELQHKDINQELLRFNINNLENILNELKNNNYLFEYTDTWSGDNIEYVSANGLKYSKQDKISIIKRTVINYIELMENNNRMEYSEEEKNKMLHDAIFYFHEQSNPNKTQEKNKDTLQNLEL